MVEKKFTAKNNNWKAFTQLGEVTREGYLLHETNVFIVQEGINYFLYIDKILKHQFPEEDYIVIYGIIKEFLNSHVEGKIVIKVIAVSGKIVKSELILKKVYHPDESASYLISIEDAEKLLSLCTQPLQTYHKYYFGIKKSYWGIEDPQTWWIKEYTGPYSGVIMTGVELKDPSEELFIPDWAGSEITSKEEYQEIDLLSLKPTKIEEAVANKVK
jgi:CYTH domain-containing protein